MTGQFQSSVNIYNPIGFPGDLAYDGPMRAAPFNLVSTPNANVIGYAFTVSAYANPDPVYNVPSASTIASPLAGTARAGGTGVFAGILVNSKEQALYGTSALNPLGPSLSLPDNTIGSLLTMGSIFANLPGPANPGDLVTYDTNTGALNSMPALAQFVGSSSTTTLTVASISAGAISVGQLITGTGVTPGTYITALGTGKGGTGTYTISISQTIGASTALTAANTPAPAFSVTGTIAPDGSNPTTAGSVLTVSAVGSGSLRIGDLITGTGIPANTVITAFGSGVGDTGTYVLNTINLTVTPGITITGPTNAIVPNAVVSRFVANTLGGVAVIKLTN